VTAIAEDATGALWVGTTAGVSRRAGGTWVTVIQAGSGNVPDPLAVTQLVEDGERTMWIRADQGLWSVSSDRTTIAKHDAAEGLPDDVPSRLLRAQDGSLWVGCPRGVAHRVEGAWQVWGPSIVGPGDVQALLEDRGGRIWAGRVFGVSYYDSGNWTRF